MNILEVLVKLRDDLKLWVNNNISLLNDKINKNKERSELNSFNISEHKRDSESHVTRNERENWNNKAEKSEIPTKLSAFENDNGYLTEIPSEYATEEEVEAKVSELKTYVENNLVMDYNDLENKPCYVELGVESVDSFELVTEEATYISVICNSVPEDSDHIKHIDPFKTIAMKVVENYLPKENFIGKTYKDYTKSVSSTFTEDMVVTDFSAMGIPDGTFPEGTYIIMSGLDENNIPIGLYGIPEGAEAGTQAVLGVELSAGIWYLTTIVITDEEEDTASSFPYGYFEYHNVRDIYHQLDEELIPDTIVREEDLKESLNDYALENHTHDDITEQINAVSEDKADKTHTHSYNELENLPENLTRGDLDTIMASLD